MQALRFGIVDNNVVTRHQSLDGTLTPLVPEIEQESIFFLHEVCQICFQFFVVFGLTRHHSGPHRIAHTPFFGSISIHFANVRMIG